MRATRFSGLSLILSFTYLNNAQHTWIKNHWSAGKAALIECDKQDVNIFLRFLGKAKNFILFALTFILYFNKILKE